MFNNYFSGSFTSDASVTNAKVYLPQGEPDMFVLEDAAWGDDTAITSVKSWWRKGDAADSARTIDQAVTTGIMSTEAVTANGFRFIDTFNPPTYTALATTAISAANPAVCTMASTGSISVGDVVRVTQSTGMLQVAGYDFSVTAVTANVSATLNFDAQNEAAAATAGFVRLIIPGRYYPRNRYIVPVGGLAGVSVAASDGAQCVVCTSVYHDFSVGEYVSFRVSDDFGMSELNNLKGIVVSIGNASGAAYSTAVAANYNALQVALDVSGMTAFTLPASATAAAGFSPAMILPAGAGPYPSANPPYVPTQAAFDSRNRYYMRCGSNVLTETSQLYNWEAYYANNCTQ